MITNYDIMLAENWDQYEPSPPEEPTGYDDFLEWKRDVLEQAGLVDPETI